MFWTCSHVERAWVYEQVTTCSNIAHINLLFKVKSKNISISNDVNIFKFKPALCISSYITQLRASSFPPKSQRIQEMFKWKFARKILPLEKNVNVFINLVMWLVCIFKTRTQILITSINTKKYVSLNINHQGDWIWKVTASYHCYNL